MLGFAFYVQPMLMPPAARAAAGACQRQPHPPRPVRIVVIGVASLVRLPLLSHTKVSPSQQCKCARALPNPLILVKTCP